MFLILNTLARHNYAFNQTFKETTNYLLVTNTVGLLYRSEKNILTENPNTAFYWYSVFVGSSLNWINKETREMTNIEVISI